MAPFAASDVLRLQWLLAATDVQRKLALFFRATKANFNPDQPRVPAGNPDGGQWTDAGGGGASQSSKPGSSGRAKGHHLVPQRTYRNLPLQPETRKVFDNAVTGRLYGDRHGWSAAHEAYNEAVWERLERFMKGNGIRPEQMTADQARDFVTEIRRSTDPRIRGFNMRIYMREIMYWLRRIPRGSE